MTEENNNPSEETPTPETESETPEPQKPKLGFFTGLTIRVLRGIISRLESTVEKLEAQAATESTVIAAGQPEAETEELRGWDKILRQVRSKFPLLQSLPDFLLTTLLVGASLAVVWGAVAIIPEGLFSSTPSSPSEEEVSQQPEKPEAPIPPPETREEPQTEFPSEQPSEPIEEKEPEPELTPEQGLIAAIQEQVSEITTRYAEGLIESIEANFRDGRLIVAVSDQWFELSEARQDELSKEMLARSRQLDFTRLVLTTPNGKLLARSPVVGEKMVILQRDNPSSPDNPA